MILNACTVSTRGGKGGVRRAEAFSGSLLRRWPGGRPLSLYVSGGHAFRADDLVTMEMSGGYRSEKLKVRN